MESKNLLFILGIVFVVVGVLTLADIDLGIGQSVWTYGQILVGLYAIFIAKKG